VTPPPVRPSFIPPEPFRALRDLTRYRKSVIEERARESQRLHKVLEDAGVKLSSVASSVLTKSGREMIDALIAGQRDATVLAEMAKGRMRSKIPTAGHLASWAGMCPGNNESAGKRKTGRTRHGSKWLRKALIEAGQAAGRSKNTYLSAQYASGGKRWDQLAALPANSAMAWS